MKKIGIVGVGGIANNAHITQLLDVKECEITAVCDINPSALKSTAQRLGLDKAHQFTDYKDLIDSDDVDAVEICTPNHIHVDIARYAVSKGKPINTEKPLGMNFEECMTLQKALSENPVVNMMSFSYRFFPAVRYAKWILEQGLLGEICGIKVEYLKSSAFIEGRRLDWRFDKEIAGSGVIGDLGAHLIDMTRLLIGEFKNVSAMKGIVVKQRKRLDSEEIADVTTEDYCNFVATVGDDNTEIPATFVITRCAIGNQNTIKFDVYGTEGTISFNLNNPKELAVCVGKIDTASDSLHTVNVPRNFFITQEQAFVDALHGKLCDNFPTIADGIACQKIIDAVLESAQLCKPVWVL